MPDFGCKFSARDFNNMVKGMKLLADSCAMKTKLIVSMFFSACTCSESNDSKLISKFGVSCRVSTFLDGFRVAEKFILPLECEEQYGYGKNFKQIISVFTNLTKLSMHKWMYDASYLSLKE